MPILWRRQWQPTPVLLPGKSHGQRSLVGCSPWGREESDMTEQLHFHFSLSCIGEGNGNPLQCSCLENPRDRGAWWAAIYGRESDMTEATAAAAGAAAAAADSISKSRDITLPTKVLLVKALVFPVVMYGCESWTIKKAEHRIVAFGLWCWRRLLRDP